MFFGYLVPSAVQTGYRRNLGAFFQLDKLIV